MKPACVFWLLCTTMLCAGVPAQQTWRVKCQGGPGVDFTDLPQAVAAAAPGDTIVVTSQSQVFCLANATDYNAPTIDKPLTIIGSFSPSASGMRAQVSGVLSITGIPAGQRVLISGISIQTGSVLPAPPHGFSITNCTGDVVIEDCYYGNWLGLAGSQLLVQNCANVVLRGTQMQLGGTPLRIIDSNVLLTTTAMQYTGPFPWWGAGYTTPTETLYVQNSAVTMVGSIVRGLSAGDWSWVKPGAIVHSGLLRVGPGSLLQGGSYSPGPPIPPTVVAGYGLGPTGAAVHRDPMGTIHTLPNSAAVVPIPSTYHSWVTANASYGVTVAGEPGSFALLVASDMISPLPTPFGPLWLDPLAAWTVDLVALPTGNHQWTFQCPSTAPIGHAFALQSLLLDPEGQILLTEPSPVLVAWAAGTIP